MNIDQSEELSQGCDTAKHENLKKAVHVHEAGQRPPVHCTPEASTLQQLQAPCVCTYVSSQHRSSMQSASKSAFIISNHRIHKIFQSMQANPYVMSTQKNPKSGINWKKNNVLFPMVNCCFVETKWS